jgi:hypothetical protein
MVVVVASVVSVVDAEAVAKDLVVDSQVAASRAVEVLVAEASVEEEASEAVASDEKIDKNKCSLAIFAGEICFFPRIFLYLQQQT